MINVFADLGSSRLGESFAVFNFAFEEKRKEFSKKFGRTVEGPWPLGSYAYGAQTRHDQDTYLRR